MPDIAALLTYAAALAPPAGVGFLFYIIIKGMIEGDRRERLAVSRWEADRAARSPEGAGDAVDEYASMVDGAHSSREVHCRTEDTGQAGPTR